jgi:hypothetical protein
MEESVAIPVPFGNAKTGVLICEFSVDIDIWIIHEWILFVTLPAYT